MGGKGDLCNTLIDNFLNLFRHKLMSLKFLQNFDYTLGNNKMPKI